MLFFLVYPESHPRLQTFQRFSEYRSTPSPVFSYSYKLPPSSAHKTSSSFSYAYKLPIFYPLCFHIHASDGGGCRGTPTFQSSTAPTFKDQSPFFSRSSALFCAFLHFLHSRKTQLSCFQAIPHSLRKTPGAWGVLPPTHQSRVTSHVFTFVFLSNSVNLR